MLPAIGPKITLFLKDDDDNNKYSDLKNINKYYFAKHIYLLDPCFGHFVFIDISYPCLIILYSYRYTIIISIYYSNYDDGSIENVSAT